MAGTTVKNPCKRVPMSGGGYQLYSICSMCGNKYTILGISRHWDKCPNRKPK